MKGKLFAVMVMIMAICGGNEAKAQYYGGFDCCEVDYSVSLAAGASLVNDFTSPVASVRLGVDVSRFIGELEFSYISINAIGENEGVYKKERLSTMTFGVNAGVKFLQGWRGHLALMLHGGYAIQEGWLNGCYDPYYDPCYYPCYDPYCGYGGGRYRGKGYFGVGLNGMVKIHQCLGLFAEARYQSIPVDGCGKTKWGAIFQGGVRFIF